MVFQTMIIKRNFARTFLSLMEVNFLGSKFVEESIYKENTGKNERTASSPLTFGRTMNLETPPILLDQ